MSTLQVCREAATVVFEINRPDDQNRIDMAVARRGLPPKVAFDLYYSGRRMGAAEALRLDLVNAAVPVGELWDAVRKRVVELEARSGAAIMVGRQGFTPWAT